MLRYSCLHASCGTCGMRINGREALACDTKVANLRCRTVRIEPIARQRLVADLATDMVDFYARFDWFGLPAVRTAEPEPGADATPGAARQTRFENCIECGLCLAACPIASADPSYLGPAALAAAWRLVEEPRNRTLDPVLAAAADRDSVWRCRAVMECSAVCPSAVDPAGSILRLRRGIAGNRLKSFFVRHSRT